QHSLEPNLGAAYFWLTLVKGGRELQQHALEDWMEEGNRALGVMDKHLALHDFFVAGHYTIADIALYAYTHVAPQCDYDLAPFPAIRAWLDRVANQSGYVPMEFRPATAVPAVWLPQTRLQIHSALCPAALMIGHPLSLSALL